MGLRPAGSEMVGGGTGRHAVAAPDVVDLDAWPNPYRSTHTCWLGCAFQRQVCYFILRQKSEPTFSG